jgi:hypothetical protein
MAEKLQATIIPAAPGWYVATLVEGKPGAKGWPDGLSLEPIIAWDVQREDGRHGEHDDLRRLWYGAVPITPNTNNVHHFGNPWVIKAPDGSYVMPDGCRWEVSEAEVIQELKDEYMNASAARRAEGFDN